MVCGQVPQGEFVMRSMQIEHFVEDGQEFVVVDGDSKYLVDRQRPRCR